MKKFLLIGLSLISTTSYAAICETNSRGFNFPGSDSYEAVNRCRTHPRTDNSECGANVTCQGDFGPGSCQTQSRGFNFPGATAQIAIDRCRSHPRTDNSECYSFVTCNDYRSQACRTRSAGMEFQGSSAHEAVSRCQANPRTNNSECSAFVSCDGDYRQGPGYGTQCETRSAGMSFVGSAEWEAINRCQAHPRTNNAECSANVACTDDYRNGGGHGGGWNNPPAPAPYPAPYPTPYPVPYPYPQYPGSVSCETRSVGMVFTGNSEAEAIGRCTSDYRTNSYECRSNLVCGGIGHTGGDGSWNNGPGNGPGHGPGSDPRPGEPGSSRPGTPRPPRF